MKKIILFLLVSLMIFACSSPSYQIVTDCNCTKEVFIEEMRKKLILNDFEIKKDSTNLSYLEGDKTAFDWLRNNLGNIDEWEILFKDDSVTARFNHMKLVYYSITSTIDMESNYLTDETSKDNNNYWIIRNSIDTLCKGKINFVEFDPKKDKIRITDSSSVNKN